MSEKSKLNVHKITLSSGKIVLLRELKIAHQEQSMQNAAQKAGENALLLASGSSKELLKILLVSVNGKDLKAAEKEDLDDLFSFPEYFQLNSIVGKLMGTDQKSEPKIEFATSGE